MAYSTPCKADITGVKFHTWASGKPDVKHLVVYIGRPTILTSIDVVLHTWTAQVFISKVISEGVVCPNKSRPAVDNAGVFTCSQCTGLA